MDGYLPGLMLYLASHSDNPLFKYGARAYYLAHGYGSDVVKDLSGQTQYENTEDTNQNEIDYLNYIRGGYERALAEWHKNVPGREIRYPELSYPGQMYSVDTGVARSMYNIDTAFANYRRGSFYATGGLYGIGSRVSRWI